MIKEDIPTNLRGFEVTMIKMTNTKGERVKIYDTRNNKTKIIPFSYEFNSCKWEAIAYLKQIGIKVLYSCETKLGYMLLTDDFEGVLK